jgi:trans-2,3-dihydro-3-hydroxyanthranilate isomerase
LVKHTEAKAIVVFCPETLNSENQLHVRVFVEYFGIPEDPATGSGNGCLAAYLVKHKYFGTNHVNVRVEQGYEIGRPSLLFLRAGPRGGSIRVQVGGRVQWVAKGDLV